MTAPVATGGEVVGVGVSDVDVLGGGVTGDGDGFFDGGGAELEGGADVRGRGFT